MKKTEGNNPGGTTGNCRFENVYGASIDRK
jgi:hypothetical protein